jgi:hypothetical protein
MGDLSEQLVGSWHLKHWKLGFSDSEDSRFVFGEHPSGLLVYTADGWMSAAICASDRAPFPPVLNHRELPDDLLTRAYHSYFHYAGRWHVQGQDVIHEVSMSLNPNFPGSRQLRHARLDGDILVLRGEEPQGERTRLHELTWSKTP